MVYYNKLFKSKDFLMAKFSKFLNSATTGGPSVSTCSDDRTNCAEVQRYCTVEPFAGTLRQQCRKTCRVRT